MYHLLKNLWTDKKGFIVSSELILVSTMVGLAMVVGLSEVSSAVNSELSDVAQGFSNCNNWCDNGGWGNNDWDNDDYGIWDSDPEHEQSGGDFYGDN